MEPHTIKHTAIAIISCFSGIAAGSLYSYHIPPIVIELLQVAAYTISACVGLLTLATWAGKKLRDILKDVWKK